MQVSSSTLDSPSLQCCIIIPMQAEVITIGDELLIGQTVDTNSAWMAKKLNAIGVSIYQITSVSDEKEHILRALKDASERSDLVN